MSTNKFKLIIIGLTLVLVAFPEIAYASDCPQGGGLDCYAGQILTALLAVLAIVAIIAAAYFILPVLLELAGVGLELLGDVLFSDMIDSAFAEAAESLGTVEEDMAIESGWGIEDVASVHQDALDAGELTFRDTETLVDHISRHAEDLGYETAEEYLNGAQELIGRGDEITTWTRPGGDTLFYDSSTNEFAVRGGDGFIRTYYSPDEGLEYIIRQILGRGAI